MKHPWRTGVLWWVALLGVVLLVWPYLPWEEEAALPATITAEAPAFRRLTGIAAAIDSASMAGHVGEVRERLTPAGWRRLQRRLGAVDAVPDAAALARQGAWVGRLPGDALLAGGSREDRACLVFEGTLDEEEASLLVLTFARGEGRWLLDDRREYPVEPRERIAAAREVLRVVLGADAGSAEGRGR